MKAIFSVLLISASAGCGAIAEDRSSFDEAPENVARESEVIVDGKRTFARPEVGFLNRNCTATLVSHQAFVTAAHCIGFAAEAAGGTFLMQKDITEEQELAVYKTYSRFDRLGGADLAVGFLAEGPPDWSDGAVMVTSPDFGSTEWGTRMGYGCVETELMGGQGVKRFRELATGPYTDVTCPMDSGGPHFKGKLADRGPLYAVASKYDAGPDPGWDTNALVDADWVEGMIRWKSGGYETGLDRFGFDYTWVDASSASACGTLCRKDPRCQAFTYVSGDGCNLKSVMGPTSPNRTTTSGPGVGSFVGDVFGSDYSFYSVERYDVCEADCARDPACKAWTFNDGTCHLKNAQPPVTTCNACRSGYRKNAFESNIDRPGAEFRALQTSSAVTCADECAKDAFCRAFSFSPTKRCSIKVGVSTPIFTAGYISGIRGGVEYNVNRAGSIYKSFENPSGQERWCQSTCRKDARCRSWSYFSEVGGGPVCHLRDAVPARSSRLGTATGVPGMEFF
ncbi:MAG TPA: PAN domain-containing protein [Polyangiaceae bacterium]